MDKQTMFPYGDRIIVRQIDVEFKSAGGLYLGEIEKESETLYGKVVAVGEGKWIDSVGLVPNKSNVGDVVIMRANAPIKINIKGLNYYAINESNVIMRLEDAGVVEKEFSKEGYEFEASGTKIMN